MNLSNMKVGQRLGLGFSLVLVLLVAVTVVGIMRMAQIQDRLDHVVSVNNVVTRLVVDMRNNVNDRLNSLRTLTLMTNPDDMEPELDRFKVQTGKYDELKKKLSAKFATDSSPQEKTLLSQIEGFESAAMPAIAKASELYLANKAEDATRVMIKEVRPVQKKWMEGLDQLAAMEDKQNAQSQVDAGTAFANARNFMLILLAVAVAIGVAAAVVITRSLLRQLGAEPDYTAKIATSIAHGDLAIAIDTKNAVAGSLLVEMNNMRGSLVDIVGQVRAGTETIGTASREIAAGNIDLSSRTEMQASSLEKTASAMEELTSTVKQNADNAREANQLAASASEVARKGGEVVSQVVDTMGSINTSANKIVDIIGVIDGIGSAQPGPALGCGSKRNQDADRRFGRESRTRQQAGRPGRRDDGRSRGQRETRHRHHERDRQRQPRTERRHRTGQPVDHRDGRHDPAKCRTGRASGRRSTEPAGPGR
jgi:methyl-accepting chemotaxis protein